MWLTRLTFQSKEFLSKCCTLASFKWLAKHRQTKTSKTSDGWFTSLLCKVFPYKEIGWKDIGETFHRWTLLRTPWFRVYLHRLDCEHWHNKCHDHPWDFLAIILWGGYWEEIHNLPYKNIGQHCGGNVYWRRPGSILYRPAESAHSVATQVPNWSLVIVGNKRRSWGMFKCKDGSEYMDGAFNAG